MPLRKISCLASFYKWAKHPRRIPVWRETEEQNALMKATRNYGDIPDNIFGRSRASAMKVRQRYELLFELIQKSGLGSARLWA